MWAGSALRKVGRAVTWASGALLACGGGTEPGDVVPRLLTYDYVFETPFSGAGAPAPRRCSGTFQVTRATADSIGGTWNVPSCFLTTFNTTTAGYQPAALLGGWNVDAYAIWARPTTGGQHTHRFSRRGGILRCDSAGIAYGTSGGGVASVPSTTCTLTPR